MMRFASVACGVTWVTNSLGRVRVPIDQHVARRAGSRRSEDPRLDTFGRTVVNWQRERIRVQLAYLAVMS